MDVEFQGRLKRAQDAALEAELTFGPMSPEWFAAAETLLPLAEQGEREMATELLREAGIPDTPELLQWLRLAHSCDLSAAAAGDADARACLTNTLGVMRMGLDRGLIVPGGAVPS